MQEQIIKMKLRKKCLVLILLLSAVLALYVNNKYSKAQENEAVVTASPTPDNSQNSGDSVKITDGTQKVKILFIGNSHTYYNYMPHMVQGLALASGIDCEVMVIAANGFNLSRFASKDDPYGAMVYDKLKNYKWDYVVLQENRNRIIEKPGSSENSFKTLYKEINKSGAKTVVYVPHADKNGNYFAINDKVVYLTNYQISEMMSRNNYEISNQLDALTADYSMNCMRMMIKHPEINLYKSDMLHPSVNGSYLAACTIFSTIFNKSPYGNKYLPGSEFDQYGLLNSMNKDKAITIQNMADLRLSANSSYNEVSKGTTGRLYATYLCNDSNTVIKDNNSDIYWRSVNPEAVSINKITGEFTALASGRYLVEAYTDSGLSVYATINVLQASEAITVNHDGVLKLYIGDTAKYNYSLVPSDSTDSVTWSSDNPAVVTVDQNGNITAKGAGTAKITALASSGVRVNRYVRVILKNPSNITLKANKVKKVRKTKVTVKWNTVKGAVRYQIYRKTDKQKSYKKIGSTKQTKFIDKSKKKKLTYSYKVIAIHSNSKCNSDFSKVKSIKLPLTSKK